MNAIHDNFERYYAEKLWEMIPAFYRMQDAEIAQETTKSDFKQSTPQGPLRELVEILAQQAAVLRRSSDQLWEDQFVEFCNDWAIPYIADVLQTRLVSSLNQRGRRVDVAKTVYYRRRKGTLRVLEELISDITGWEGTVVESFRRLARTRHRLDPEPEHYVGPQSKTPPGGTANLRNPHMGRQVGTPFDEYYHTADLRKNDGGDEGRYAINKLIFHIYRMQACRINNVTPYALDDGTFTFDPSGREVDLFKPRSRGQDPLAILSTGDEYDGNWENWRLAAEMELPGPLAPQLLQELIDRDLLDRYLWLRPAGSELDPGKVVAGLIGNRDMIPAEKDILVDPGVGRFAIRDDAVSVESVSYHYGSARGIGAGSYDRGAKLERPDLMRTMTELVDCNDLDDEPQELPSDRHAVLKMDDLDNNGVTQINDSGTYVPATDKRNVKKLVLQAANFQRPMLQLTDIPESNLGSNFSFFSTDEHDDGELILDGLWIVTDGSHSVRINGDFERVVIRNCTFDPGGERVDGTEIPQTRLLVFGRVEELVIENSIMGSIEVFSGGVHTGFVQRIVVRDSILTGAAGTRAIEAWDSNLDIKASTVLDEVRVGTLKATDSLFLWSIHVKNKQTGYFRFSAAPEIAYPPRPSDSVVLKGHISLFESLDFGHPQYARLRADADERVRFGAEDKLEMGAFNRLREDVKFTSLQAKVQEFMPFGLTPVYIFEN